jgi:hypothetical protein
MSVSGKKALDDSHVATVPTRIDALADPTSDHTAAGFSATHCGFVC